MLITRTLLLAAALVLAGDVAHAGTKPDRTAAARLRALAEGPGEPTAAGDELAPAQTSTAVQTKPQPPPWPPFNLYALLDRGELIATLERRHAAAGSFPALIERVTRGFVAAPYLLSPLGEDAMPDPDPRLRIDAFDCTTFVETAIAFARCDGLDDIARELDLIRYDGGEVAFTRRRHLMASDWVPGLIALGYVEDITASVGGAATKRIDLALDAARWKRRRIARSLDLPPDVIPHGTFPLPYIPTERVLALAASIPAGTILNVVRKDVPYSPEVITHQGIVLVRPGEDRRIVRHASPVSKRVIDESLDRMITRYLKPKAWAIVGVNLLRIVEPAAPE